MPTGVNSKALFRNKTTNYLSGIDLIKSELETLLSIQKFSLFFGNNIGLGPEKYLGLSSRTATFNLIKREIEVFFSKYNRVKLVGIEMSFDNSKSELIINLKLATTAYRSVFDFSFSIGE